VKICSKCGIKKDLDKFSKGKNYPDGLKYECKSCNKAYKIENNEKLKIKQRAYRDSHKEKISTYRTNYKKSDDGKAAAKRSLDKYPNANKSRSYYRHHKHKIKVYDSCQECNSNNRVEAHHSDYDKPLDVIFLCVDCHSGWHLENTPINRVTGIFTIVEKQLNLKAVER